MDINFSCPSCNQHISANSAMRGRSISCPACGESLKVPAKSQFASSRSSDSNDDGGRKLILAIVICCFIAAAWISISALSQFIHQAKAAQARSARRAQVRAAAPINAQAANRPRYSFQTNEMWLKPLNGDLDGVKEILDKNPQRLEERIGGMRATLLHVAAFGGQPKVVEELLKRGAEVNLKTSQGHTPLYDCIAGRNPSVEICKMLLDAKADFTIADGTGKTPLQLATERNKQDIVDLLKQYGAKK
ncbi:MAG TPA: ankyrin repeat domain-containing protein [Candidatus Baltobacteraceae bacterium]|nr:ankyrin repeat domain-containing protein [Candidatus Baltobacteraceae bacterium]